MYLSADEPFTPPGLSNSGESAWAQQKSSRDMAVNKKVMQEGGGGWRGVVEWAPTGRRNLFPLVGRFIERLPDPHGSVSEMKSSAGGPPVGGQGVNLPAEVNW